MLLKKTVWRIFTIPILLVFFTNQVWGSLAMRGVGQVVRPSSPFDPAQPFMVYIPGDTLKEMTTLEYEGSDGVFSRTTQQTLLNKIDELGVFPHMPLIPEYGEKGTLRVYDSSVRWAKPFHGQLFGGDFYLGYKKTLMTKLHRNHIYIVTALRALGALAQANPSRYFRGFGRYEDTQKDGVNLFKPDAEVQRSLPAKINDPFNPGREINTADLLAEVMTKVKASHDTLASIFVLPPANIDPDLMLNWLDSYNIGPQYEFSGTRQSLVGKRSEINEHIKQYCAMTYVPWAVNQNVRRGLITEPREQELTLAKRFVDRNVFYEMSKKQKAEGKDEDEEKNSKIPIIFPKHIPLDQKGNDPYQPLNLDAYEIGSYHDPETNERKYRVIERDGKDVISRSYESPQHAGINLYNAVVKELVGEDAVYGNNQSLRALFESTRMTTLTYLFLDSQFRKLKALPASYTHLRDLKNDNHPKKFIHPEDIVSLLEYYTQEQNLDQNRLAPRDFITMSRSLFHIPERSLFADLNRLQGGAQVYERRMKSGSLGSSREIKQKWIERQIEQTSNLLCQSLFYQNFYDRHLTVHGGDRSIPNLSDIFGDTDIYNTISHPDLISYFEFPKNRRMEEWKRQGDIIDPNKLFPLMKGWGYFYDILVRFNQMPISVGGNLGLFTTDSISLNNHEQVFFPGMINPPNKMWHELFNLMKMNLDLTILPEFYEKGSQKGKSSRWLFQDSGYQAYEEVMNVTQSTSEYLNYRSKQSNMDALKQVSMYLFRNRTGFTPQEKYLFLTSYFKEYLLPLAHLFTFFTTQVFDDAKLSSLINFQVPKGAVSPELVQLLSEEGGIGNHESGNNFLVRESHKKDGWKFEINPQGQNLHISFLDPILARFKEPPPVEDATSYGKLENSIAKLNHYIDQRVRWCWSTPRHTLPMRDFVDQTVQVDDLSGNKSGDLKEAIHHQVKARNESASPYLYPRTGSGAALKEEFPISGVVQDPNNRDMWLNLLCAFPTFIRYYFEGYTDLAQQYQQAMQVFRHAELFQRKRIMDTAHLTYLEGLPERAVFQLDYAMVDDKARQKGQLNRTIYAREVGRYMREKQTYMSTFDNVQSMLDGVFKADYTASDYIHALEQVYLGIVPINEGSKTTIGAEVYKAAAKANSELGESVVDAIAIHTQKLRELDVSPEAAEKESEKITEVRKQTESHWLKVHGVINEVVNEKVKTHANLDGHYFYCRQEQDFRELHLIYQNKLACSLQRQMVYKIMLQRTLRKYRDAMDTFFDIHTFTATTSSDPFEKIIQWAATKFSDMLSDPKLGDLAKKLAEDTEPDNKEAHQDNPLLGMMGMAQDPRLAAALGGGAAGSAEEAPPTQQEAEPEDISWEDALGEVERIQADIVGSFLGDITQIFKQLRPDNMEAGEAEVLYKHVMVTYREAVKQAFTTTEQPTWNIPTKFYDQKIQGLKSIYWFFGPNVLFENPNFVPETKHYLKIRENFDHFYRMVPLSGDKSIPGLAFNEKEDITGMRFETEGNNSREERDALVELLRKFDLQLLKYSMNNIVNAKMLLGEDALTPVSQDIAAEVGGLGLQEVKHVDVAGSAEIYGEVAPFEMLLFVFNRQSPTLRAWRHFISNVTVLNAVTPELGVSTPMGTRLSSRPYADEDWLGMNAIVGRVGKMMGWSERDSNWHLMMHKAFCKMGARLRGGTLAQDLLQANTYQWEWWPDLKSVEWNLFNLFSTPETVETVIDKSQEKKDEFSTHEYVEYREDFEDWYCDVYSIDRKSPATQPFTLAEMDVVRVANQRIAATKHELQEESFADGSKELRRLQGSKMFESAMLWTTMEMMNLYVIEPYMKSGFALQELFADIDMTLRNHMGLFVNEADRYVLPMYVKTGGVLLGAAVAGITTASLSGAAAGATATATHMEESVELGARGENLLNSVIELKGKQAWASFANNGVLMDFLTRVQNPENELETNDTYQDFQERLLEVMHLNYVEENTEYEVDGDVKPYDVVDGKVDVPGVIDGDDKILKFLSGDEPHKFYEDNLTWRMPGGKDRTVGPLQDLLTWLPRKAMGLGKQMHEGGAKCISEVSEVREGVLGNKGKLSKTDFEALSPKNQKTYLRDVKTVNALEQYAAYLEIENPDETDPNNFIERPGFCYLKRLAFNTAYQILVGKNQLETEAQKSWDAYQDDPSKLKSPCRQLVSENEADKNRQSHDSDLMFNLGQNTVNTFRELVNNTNPEVLNQKYCHHIVQAFRSTEVFQSMMGYGIDKPEEDALSDPSDQTPTPGQPPPQKKKKRKKDNIVNERNLLIVYQAGMNELEQWRNRIIQNISLRYPQLDKQISNGRAFGDILALQTQERRFIPRAYVEILNKYSPSIFPAMQKLVRSITHHSGPLCEVFQTSLLSSQVGQTRPRDEMLESPQLRDRLVEKFEGETYVLGSNLCRDKEAVSNFTYTQWAKKNGKISEDRLERAKNIVSKNQKDRVNLLMNDLLAVFPWMADVRVVGGQQPVNFQLWLDNYGTEGPSTALYLWSQNYPDDLASGVESFVWDDGSELGYGKFLKDSIQENISLIAQQYHASHNVMRSPEELNLKYLEKLSPTKRYEEEKRLEKMDRATLYQLLAMRFSIPHLYDQVRKEVGPRYDKYYYYFVPVHVWAHFKKFEEYQSVVGTFTGAIFVMQMLISFNFMTNILRRVMGSFIRVGSNVGRGVGGVVHLGDVGGKLGAAGGFAATTALSIMAANTVGSFLAYRVFNIFGANWRPIKIAFFLSTVGGSVFIGLNRIQIMNWLFRGFGPALYMAFQLFWYVFLMDIVMYFGDKVTWDYASREYGYYKALYETYMTRRRFQLAKDSSVARMFKRESEIYEGILGNHQMAAEQKEGQDNVMTPPAPLEHSPIFSEYEYVKHLHRTSQVALSYMWFGILMAGAMDYAQLRSFMRFKGANAIPFRGITQWLPDEFREFTGVEGVLDTRVTENKSRLGETKNLDEFRSNLNGYISRWYESAANPFSRSVGPEGQGDPVRLSRAVTDLVRSMAWASSRSVKGGWHDAAVHTQFVLKTAFADGEIRTVMKEGMGLEGARIDQFMEAVEHEIRQLDWYTISETTLDPTRIGSPAQHPNLTQALKLLEQSGKGQTFLSHLTGAITDQMVMGNVSLRHFKGQLTFHHAKWSLLYEKAESFRSFSKKRDALALQEPDLGEAELRSRVLERILAETDWKTVDNEIEFQIIRYVVWNNSVMQFLKTHGMFWVGKGLRGVGAGFKKGVQAARATGQGIDSSIRHPGEFIQKVKMTPQALRRFTDYIKSGTQSWGHTYFGETIDEAEDRMYALIGGEIAKTIHKKRDTDLEGYVMDLRDLMPYHIENAKKHVDDLPPFLQRAVNDVSRDYNQLRESSGADESVPPGEVPGKLGAMQRASGDDTAAIRGFFDLWSIGLLRKPEFEGPQAQLVRELSTPALFDVMKRYEFEEFLYYVRDLATQFGVSDDELKGLVAQVLGIEKSSLGDEFGSDTIRHLFTKGWRKRSRVYGQDLMGKIMATVIRKNQSTPLTQYEALVKFKVSLIEKIDEVKSGTLAANLTPLRIVTPEDLQFLQPHMRALELSSLAEGDLLYARSHTMVQGQTAEGKPYRLYTADADAYDSFFAGVRATDSGWLRPFGAVGPYLFLKTDVQGSLERLQDSKFWPTHQPPMLNDQTLHSNWDYEEALRQLSGQRR
jgi:hypothetical protein